MGNSYIYNKVEKLVKKFKTRDPFEILEEMNVIVGETDRYEKLKGYCFMSCQTIYVMVSSFLSEEEKKDCCRPRTRSHHSASFSAQNGADER